MLRPHIHSVQVAVAHAVVHRVGAVGAGAVYDSVVLKVFVFVLEALSLSPT